MNLQKIEFSEYIDVGTWESLVKELNHPNFLYCPIDQIQDTFRFIEQNPKENYVVVSGCSDYGLEYQDENPINNDLRKVINFVRFDEIEQIRDRYVHLRVPSANYEQCSLSDRFSVKIYAYTGHTFDKTPTNLKRWYCTNSNIDSGEFQGRVKWIPFGVNNDGPGSSYIPGVWGLPKKNLLYVNFQGTTMERVRLKDIFSYLDRQNTAETSWNIETNEWLGQLIYRDSPNIPVKTYLEELSGSKFVISPRGNGHDCYRHLECIYAGSIPILEKSRLTEQFIRVGLPVMVCNGYEGIKPSDLERVWDELQSYEFNYDTVRLSFWREKFKEELTNLDCGL